MVQTIKNPPAMRETWVPSLGWEDPLEEGMATQSSTLAWRMPWTEEPGGCGPQGRKELDMTEQLTHTHTKHLGQSLVSGSFPTESAKKESPHPIDGCEGGGDGRADNPAFLIDQPTYRQNQGTEKSLTHVTVIYKGCILQSVNHGHFGITVFCGKTSRSYSQVVKNSAFFKPRFH